MLLKTTLSRLILNIIARFIYTPSDRSQPASNAGPLLSAFPLPQFDLRLGWPVPTEISCGSPPAILNGAFRSLDNATSVGSLVEYRCSEDRFELVGAPLLRCGPDGRYDAEPPVCRGECRAIYRLSGQLQDSVRGCRSRIKMR